MAANRRTAAPVTDTSADMHRNIGARITPEAFERLKAISSATGWTYQDIISAALVNLHDSRAMDAVLVAVRNLRKEFKVKPADGTTGD